MLTRVNSLVGALPLLALPGSLASPVDSLATPSWVTSLEADGYIVREGVYGYFDVETCAHTDTCYALNPLTPYGLIYLPPHPNESATEVPGYQNTCHVHSTCRQVGDEIWAPGWRVGPGETVVLVGRTPPKSTYWSFTNYLFSRFEQPGFSPSTTDIVKRATACASVPKDGPGKRCEVFAGVNDPLNYLTVNSEGPFDASFSMVISWDSDSEATLASHLTAGGAGPVNTLRYPAQVLRLGATRGDEDEFINLLRVEGVTDAAAREDFYKNPPFRVFRVTPGPKRALPDPAKQWPSFDGHMRPRATGHMEGIPGKVTSDDLKDGLAQMKKGLLSKHNLWVEDYAEVDFQSFVKDSGYECLSQGTRCLGDCRDTIYGRATLLIDDTVCNATHLPCKPSRRSELTADPADALYVLGVNHERTEQATYSSLTIYNYPRLQPGVLLPGGHGSGQYTLVDKDYSGTAQLYLPAGHPAAPYLYLVKFARSCNASDAEFCVEVPSVSADPSKITLSLESQIVLIERMYIRPGQASGPAVNETIFSQLLHVRPWKIADDAASVIV